MPRTRNPDHLFLNNASVQEVIRNALQEDIGRCDRTSICVIPASRHVVGSLYAKQDFRLAGLGIAALTFKSIDPTISFRSDSRDGDLIKRGAKFASVRGKARALLSAERTALNFLQRMSGIATLTSLVVDRVKGTGARVLDTRKTTPLLRMFEKYAITVGGGFNHRFGLDDGILIKDNHIRIAGGIKKAIRFAKQKAPRLLRIEVEVGSLKQFKEALAEGADVILLDNLDVKSVAHAVGLARGKSELEASGGITLENIRDYALTGVNYISLGALTHSAGAVDISFEI